MDTNANGDTARARSHAGAAMSTIASEESSDFEHPMASEPRWSSCVDNVERREQRFRTPNGFGATLEQLFRMPSGFGATLEQLFQVPSGLGSTLEQLFRAPSGLGGMLEYLF